jgi:hypothetical protein
MKLLRTTALTAALMTAAVPSLTSSAHAWWGCGGERGWGGVGLGLWYPAYGYGYPAYSGYSYPAYGYGYASGYRYASIWNSGTGTGYIYDYPAHSFSYGYGTASHRRHIYATAAGVHHYRHWH